MVLIIQLICILLVSTGLIFEIYFGADLGFVLITAGSLLFAISEKINRYKTKKYYKSTKTWKE